MLRTETKARARALQMLYAREAGGEDDMARVATGIARLTGPEPAVFDRAEALASGVLAELPALDRAITGAADNWRLDRLGAIERNILRLGIHELREGETPPKVVIDEAVRLAHWFGGARTPAFINGVLDKVARADGRL
jgi:transcription antitermination protein NusB